MTAPTPPSPPVMSGTAAGRSALAIMVFGLLPFSLGYFLSYLFRAVNAVVAPDLVRELGLNAAQLGFLTAAYLLAFALFQLPLGILLDRYGPRRVQAGLLAIAATGACLFALGRDTTSLTIARALIGLGFAGGLMSGFKAVVLFVPEPRRALASSGVMSFGALGLIVSTAPMEWLVAQHGWRTVFFGLSAVTASIAALILIVVPRVEAAGKPEPMRSQIASVVRILRDPAFLRLAPLIGLSAGTHIAIQTLWAGPWWRDVGGLDRAGVAYSLLLMSTAFFVGVLGGGVVADFFVRRGVSILNVMLGYMIAFIGAQICVLLNVQPLLSWLMFGMLGQVAVLAFPWLSSYFGAALSGRANAAMNLMIFSSAFIAQSAIGGIIDLFPRAANGGYPEVAYQTGFGVFIALEIMGLLWFLAGRRRLLAGRSAA